MANITTQLAKYGDSDDTLLVKLAKAAQTFAGVVNSTDIREQVPQPGQKNSNLLRLAHALQQIA